MTFPVRSISRSRARLAVSVAAAVLALGAFAHEAAAQNAPAQPKPVQPKPAQPQAGQPAPQQGQQAPQQAQVISTSWTKLCNTDPQAKKEICLITQEIRAETGQFLASVAIREIEGDPKKTFIIATPWGMQLQPGLRVVVDQQPPANAKYAVCFPNACYGDMEINADFVKKMKAGQALTIQTLNQANRTVSFTMPLTGFGKAYDGPALDPKTVEEQQKKLQDEMQKRAEELRKKLLEQGNGAAAATAPK
ncbi:invasion associated locus B family protein [Blastochloris viridis]|uniref:Invasion protein B n=1 Tax=Blastochloris viridis TaxID=1079 RepID=A0A0H5BQF2_BLAVI|nr:invasion associated locus B family protein [Blastochloris viridis]ALK09284.1 Invasion associated locus B (IalB) protein [Blastochloris viridis]BAS00844.1 invasion protein B [Blastochloris viridis]CUU41947.1 Invasion protein B, involved in pathogenesis [Blastochloris viridis]